MRYLFLHNKGLYHINDYSLKNLNLLGSRRDPV